MFDPDEFLEAARGESDDYLRVMAVLAAESRDWHALVGNDAIGELFQAVAVACAQVRDERLTLAREVDSAGVTLVWEDLPPRTDT